MFSELTALAEILISAIKGRSHILGGRQRRKTLLALMTAYYSLLGILRTGKKLLRLAGKNPTQKIKTMPPQERKQYGHVCEVYIAEQLARLEMLGKILQEQSVLDLLDISLRDDLERVIGDKSRGLFMFGAVLKFYLIFGPVVQPKARFKLDNEMSRLDYQAGIICSMYPCRRPNLIDLKRAERQLFDLQSAGRRLRASVQKLCSREEMIQLAPKAERAAQLTLSRR